MTSYHVELSFFRKTMECIALPVSQVKRDLPLLMQVDHGLRSNLGLAVAERSVENHLRLSMKPNTIYRITDEFGCIYLIFLLPGVETEDTLIIGPYVQQECDREWVEEFCSKNMLPPSWCPVLEEYYNRVRKLTDSSLLQAAVNVLADCMWGQQNFSTEEISGGLPDTIGPLINMSEHSGKESFMADVRSIELRYEAENRLMQAVMQGRTHRARLMLSSVSKAGLELRADEPVRNMKNYSVILNTLLRKAVEQGGVHPLYIDRMSSEFARRIEQITRWEEFAPLWQEMAHKYCVMVKKHSSQKYSQLVQQVISRVDYDLSADLSLKANAEALNVNASYLSALFKKEKGMTLTEYVNRKRVEHAVYLLNNTTLSVSSVGQYCGIQDDNYFTKMFKKYTGKTPKQFRQENARFPK